MAFYLCTWLSEPMLADCLLNIGTNLSEILMEILTFHSSKSFENVICKMVVILPRSQYVYINGTETMSAISYYSCCLISWLLSPPLHPSPPQVAQSSPSTSYHLKQCLPSSAAHYDTTSPQCVNGKISAFWKSKLPLACGELTDDSDILYGHT